MKKPLISVIMGIYNCEDTLEDAINAIKAQTYTNWELIMCDDGSTDHTADIAERYCQSAKNMTLIKNDKNLGLNQTLNNCLKLARGEYIARMDGDDLCSADRFEKEVAVLSRNEGISIVSTAMNYFDENGIYRTGKMKEFPEKKDYIKGTPFCHAPCMVLKKAYDAVGGYSVDKRLLRVEDYHLWVKMCAMGFMGMNIQEPLYSMRDDRNALKRRKFKYRINEAYVKYLAIKMLDLPIWNLIYILKPILVGLLPMPIYSLLHRHSCIACN